MTKLQIFIDFEAISAPFSHKLNINSDLPFAYSIGIHVGNKFKTKTTIINFNKVSKDDVYEFIRIDITDKIRTILNNGDFKVNRETIQFVGWAPNLEKKILEKAFRGIVVVDQLKGESLSLSTLTSEEFKDNDYFTELKKEVNKNLDPEFIQRRGLNLDGALAALAGYELYRSATNMKRHWEINMDPTVLIKEVIEYSKDDIERMSFLHKNPGIFFERKEELKTKIRNKQIVSRQITRMKSFITALQNFDKDLTIEKVLEKSKLDLEELKKNKDNL